MTVAIRIASARSHREPDSVSGAGGIAHIEVLEDIALAEPIWRRLEREDALKTPYQSFELLAAWQRQVGAPTGVTPFLVVGFDADSKPIFLWPFGRAQTGLLNVISFLGGKHANFNFALWRRDAVQSITADDIRAVIAQIAAGYQVDILSLLGQPQWWEGIINPFALLPHQPSPSSSRRLTLRDAARGPLKQVVSSSMRGRLRGKERRLRKLSGYRYMRATTPAEVDRLLEAFFALKAAHMTAQALPNIFARPYHEAFLRDACHQGLAAGTPLIEIHALQSDGELLALFAGVSDGRRFSGMFNTFTLSDNARQSPGLVLLVDVIDSLADRGLLSFDLGVGEATYKTFFCKEPEPLFDSFLPLTPLGRLAAITASAGGHVKRTIKQNRVLWRVVQTLRQGIATRP